MSQTPYDTEATGDPDATLLPEGSVARPEPALGPGVKVDRYTIIERVGAGAMGVVFSAWDAELDRRVALKVVRGDGYGTAALLREAKALAKLSHPNVVAVFDVGTHGDALFIAMEYLRGQTLAAWREANPDAGLQEVVRLYLDAGSGLAAAHDAGLVHRDFKPANAMVTEGGAVKVLDFGLAQLGDETAGSRAGTPKYMAPEQHLGEADARSDQFSFGVALYEALFRQRPFGEQTAVEVSLRTAAADPITIEGRTIPAHLRRALQRSLSADPQARFDSMQDLLQALAPQHEGRRGRIAALVGVGALVTGMFVWSTGRDGDTCKAAASALFQVWTPEVRERIDDNLDDELVPKDLARAGLDEVEAFADRWADSRLDACRATHVQHTQTQAVLELRYRCLDRRLDQFAVLIDTLTTDSATVKLSLADVLETVPALGRCEDLDALRASYPPPEGEEDQETARTLAKELEEIKALRLFDPQSALTRLEQLDERVEALGYPPLQVQARGLQGSTLGFLGRRDEGVALVEDAVALGTESNARDATVSALYELARLRSAYDKDTRDALFLDRLATSMARGLPSRDDHYSHGLESRMDIYLTTEMGEEAVAEGRKWLTEIEARGDSDGLPGIRARVRMAYALTMNGDYDEADAMLEALLQEPSIGDGHPLIARSYTYRARLRHAQGDYEGALDDHLAAYERFSALYGETHLNAAGRLGDAASTLVEANRLEEAITMAQRALDAMARGPAPRPPRSSIIANEFLAEAAYNVGRYALAIEALDEAELHAQRIQGPFPTWRKLARARIAEARGEHRLARDTFARIKAQAPDATDKAAAQIGLYIADIAEGEDEGAKAGLLEMLERSELTDVTRARAAWGLALLEARRRQPQTARRHIERARVLLGDHPQERMLRRKLDAVEREL